MIIIPSREQLVKDFCEAEEADVRLAAKKKLARIIAREGDLGGTRYKPDYLEQLVNEEKYQRAMKSFCMAHFKGGRNHDNIQHQA
jgi:hypothetical protein